MPRGPCEERHLELAGSDLLEVLLRIAGEQALAGAELPQHDAHRVHVDATVADLLARDLRSDVAGLREHDTGDGVAAAVVPARGAEVDQLQLAGVADHHVLGREIAVDDPERSAVRASALVHVRERLAHLDHDRDRLGPADARADLHSAMTRVRERAALDVLDDGVRLAVFVRRCLQDLRDPGVIELRLDASLVEETRQERAVVDVIATHGLHDDRALGALDPGRRREVDVAHPATSEELEEEEPAEDAGQRNADDRRRHPLGLRRRFLLSSRRLAHEVCI